MQGQNPGKHQNKEASKRIKFTEQEDEKLRFLTAQFGTLNWMKISEFMPHRTAKQCRDRYCNYLSEKTTNEPWTKEEDEILLTLLPIVGSKWVKISQHLPGRSGINVKNRWYKHLKKRYFFPNINLNPIKSNIHIEKAKFEEVNEPKEIENKDENIFFDDFYDYDNLMKTNQKYAISSLLV